MIIKDTKRSLELLMKSPVYMMTGDLETARFYSMLAGASSKFGFHLEDVISENINLPTVEWGRLRSCNVRSMCQRPRIDKKVPDFIFIDPINMLLSVEEIKTNLNSLDSKQCIAESRTYLALKRELQVWFPEYRVEVDIVNWFAGKNNRGNLVHPEINIITGEEFCEFVCISYDDVLNDLSADRDKNVKVISEYKERPVVVTKQDNERLDDTATLDAFFDF